MTSAMKTRPSNMGELEQLVMDYLWSHGPSTAERCREALLATHAMKDSTVRTVLRRLEEKGFLRHDVEGRTFVYRATQARRSIAARGVRHIVDHFCGGAGEPVLVRVVEDEALERTTALRPPPQIARKKL